MFNSLVEKLSTEGQTRNLAIASREGASNYRVRGYLAAQVVRGRTHISWVWDVYDDDKLRTLRITGEEAGRGARAIRGALPMNRCCGGSRARAWTSSPRSESGEAHGAIEMPRRRKRRGYSAPAGDPVPGQAELRRSAETPAIEPQPRRRPTTTTRRYRRETVARGALER